MDIILQFWSFPCVVNLLFTSELDTKNRYCILLTSFDLHCSLSPLFEKYYFFISMKSLLVKIIFLWMDASFCEGLHHNRWISRLLTKTIIDPINNYFRMLKTWKSIIKSGKNIMYTFTIMVHIANVYIIFLPDFIM